MKLSSAASIIGAPLLIVGTASQPNGPQPDRNVSMVQDLATGHLKSSSPTFLTECHGYLYFLAGEDGYFTNFGAALFKYDGSTDTISRVFGGERHGLTCFQDKLYYFKGLGGSWGVFKSDGLTETLLYDTEDSGLGYLDRFVKFQSQLYFGLTGPKLLKTDGNTVEVAWDLQTGWSPTNSEPQKLTEHDGELYFIAENEAVGGESLWKYDGTSGSLVADLSVVTGDTSPIPDWLTSYKGDLFFQLGFYSGKGQMLVKWDGESVSMVDAIPGLNISPSWLAVFKDDLYMTVYQRNTGQYHLWKYNGETAARVAYNVDGKIGHPGVTWTTPFDDSLFFCASDGTIPDSSVGLTQQLWVWDGDVASVVEETFPFDPSWLTPYQGRLYFSGGGDGTGHELWVYTPDGWEKPTSTLPTGNGGQATPTASSGSDTTPSPVNGTSSTSPAGDNSPPTWDPDVWPEEAGNKNGVAGSGSSFATIRAPPILAAAITFFVIIL